MEKCIFCEIVKGNIPCTKVYEDDDVLAFLDISQTTKGHVLVIPKEHYDSFLSTPKDIMHKVMDVAQRIGQAAVGALKCEGVNFLTNCGEIAGQSVKHFHVHVIPRYFREEGFHLEMKNNGDAKDLQLPAIAQSIKEQLKK